MITASASLAELAAHGSRELAPYLGRPRPPETCLEWLGIAVAREPDLGQRARTSDQINRRQTHSAHLHDALLRALTETIAGAAALVERALTCHLERHPASGDGGRQEDNVQAYATLLVDAHRSAPRRAEFLISGYGSFLGGAIEAAGALAEAELGVARRRRWDRADPERLVAERSAQVYSALLNALGGLLAYARLTAEDRRAASGNF
ncbi:MAG: hypothetical protein QOF65_980 [Thermoleophilaceae bacterium]|nr:hypothetical protein [Thermoleophilaceae bacterium]MEA2436424.1 hypothetical protein [Thermoleophilaceae bacterium]